MDDTQKKKEKKEAVKIYIYLYNTIRNYNDIGAGYAGREYRNVDLPSGGSSSAVDNGSGDQGLLISIQNYYIHL